MWRLRRAALDEDSFGRKLTFHCARLPQLAFYPNLAAIRPLSSVGAHGLRVRIAILDVGPGTARLQGPVRLCVPYISRGTHPVSPTRNLFPTLLVPY